MPLLYIFLFSGEKKKKERKKERLNKNVKYTQKELLKGDE